MERAWPALQFGEVTVETAAEQHVFEVEVYLGDLDPAAVRVELYADGVDGGGPIRQEMERSAPLAGATNRLRLSRTSVRRASGD